jgi:hypothetical protein
VNELHIGLKGTMGALFLKDLADKTRRGLRGRVEAGMVSRGWVLCLADTTAKSTITEFAQNENFRLAHPPTICDGLLGYVWRMNKPVGNIGNFAFGINCSSGLGGSGGAVVIRAHGEEPKYIGLVSVSGSSSYDRRPFDNDNYTGGPLLEGEFYDALSNF